MQFVEWNTNLQLGIQFCTVCTYSYTNLTQKVLTYIHMSVILTLVLKRSFVKMISRNNSNGKNVSHYHAVTVYCGKLRNVTLIFSIDKNFVKPIFSLKKLLRSWFHEIFFLVFVHCGSGNYRNLFLQKKYFVK